MSFTEAPRVALGHWPTPLERMDRLRAELGCRPRLWIKRDDCSGLATGGNKTRKLEFLIGAAQAAGATTVMTFGALQSNHARQTAAAAVRHGLACELILTRRVRYTGPSFEAGGNVLLDAVLGASLHIAEDADHAARLARGRKRAIEAAGGRVYTIPAGGSNVTGGLGYVAAAEELAAQCEAAGFHPDYLVHASSSGGTQAGLVVGSTIYLPATRVLGINTYEPDAALQEHQVRQLTQALADELSIKVRADQVRIDHRHLGEDYGLPTAAMRAAVQRLARSEGILLDPVYSGKAFAGFLSWLQEGRFDDCENVIFIHTGGTVTLPVYAADLV